MGRFPDGLVAQWIARQFPVLKAVGSSPIWVDTFFIFSHSFYGLITTSRDRSVQPLNPLSILPLALFLSSLFLVMENSKAVLQVVSPGPYVTVPIFVG